MSELVSVIITTYKRPVEIVLRAVKSVLNQTYSNIEIIVVDDSPSTFEGKDILQRALINYNDKVKYIQHRMNMGACVARNTGLEAATGYYVAFLDDDDEWLPEKIEHQIVKFQDEEIGLVYCGRIEVNDSTDEVSNDELIEHIGYVYDKLIYSNFIGSTSFPLIKKEALIEIGGFDPLMQSAQDYDVWLRLAKKYKVDCVNLPLVRYHIHNGERISTNHNARISGQERLIQKNMEYLIQNPNAWWWRLLRLSIQYSQSGRLKEAVSIWLNCCTKQPFCVFTNIKYLVYILHYFLKIKRCKK